MIKEYAGTILDEINLALKDMDYDVHFGRWVARDPRQLTAFSSIPWEDQLST